MVQKINVFLLLVFLTVKVNAQNENLKERALNRFNFKEYAISSADDTIYYYVHQKPNTNPNKAVIYLQGTTPIPEPFFNVTKVKGGYSYVTYFPDDYGQLSDEYIFILIGLPGTPVVKNCGSLNLNKYNSLNSLDDRINYANQVIDDISVTHFKPEKLIVYGHSEGAFVASKLATLNKKITHLGVWGGSALPDFFDFILFDRKANLRGEQTDSVTHENIMGVIKQFESIAADSLNTLPTNENEITEYSNKRWWSYAEPTINHLINIDIPIYMQLGTEDESSPVESNYLVPLEFARLGKSNLSFNVCIGCDHGFTNVETGEDHWSEIFRHFIAWTEQ